MIVLANKQPIKFCCLVLDYTSVNLLSFSNFRKLFVLACFGTAHLFNFFFLFLCIKDNHSLKSLGHFWWTILHDYICCKFKLFPCLNCSNKNSDSDTEKHLRTGNGVRSSSNDMYGGKGGNGREQGGCLGCCLRICPCLSCCPCCGGKGQDTGHRYSSETDLRNILVKSKNLEDFELKIVDAEDNEVTDKRKIPEVIIKSEPIVITNTARRAETPVTIAERPEVEVIDGFSDDERRDQVTRVLWPC